MGRNQKKCPAKSADSGQAVVEMAVALIAIMVLVTAVIQAGLICRKHSETMAIARREVAGLVVASEHIRPLAGGYILDWHVGADGRAYSSDDHPLMGSSFGEEAGVLHDYANPVALEAWSPGNRFSRLSFAASLVDEFALVRGYHSGNARNMPVTRRLIYNNHSDTINVKSDAWLVWTGGLY